MYSKKGNAKIWVIVLVIILGLVILTAIIGGGCYLLYKIGNTNNTTNNQTKPANTSKTGWLDYKNSRYNFAVKYPQSFEKTESINGDGATFTSQSPAITLRIFGVLATGMTAEQYLAMGKESLITEMGTVEEIGNESFNLGNLPGKRLVLKYKDPVLGEFTVEDQITAVKNDVAYNLTMTIAFSDYSEYSKMLEEMAATFSL